MYRSDQGGAVADSRDDQRGFHRRARRAGGGCHFGRVARGSSRSGERGDSQAHRRRRVAGAGGHRGSVRRLAHVASRALPLWRDSGGRDFDLRRRHPADGDELGFSQIYWTGWNARLRDLSKAAQRQHETRWESLALVGVGFMTIFREGFETTLFMQSLILEAGMRPVLVGLAWAGVYWGGGLRGIFDWSEASISQDAGGHRRPCCLRAVHLHRIDGQAVSDGRLAAGSSGSRASNCRRGWGSGSVSIRLGKGCWFLWDVRLCRRDVAVGEVLAKLAQQREAKIRRFAAPLAA